MEIFKDKVVAFEILKFLDLEEIQKCQLIFPEIRKLLKEKANKIHYLCKRYNLMSVEEIHNHIIPGHEYLNEIHKTQLNQKIW